MPNTKPATIEENEKVEQIRKKISQLRPFTDGDLIRWLRAQGGVVKDTVAALEKHLIFRSAWKMDEIISDWQPPEVLLKHCGFGFVGPDKSGCPVLVSFMGSTDVEGVMQSCQSADYIKFSLIPMEIGIRQCQKLQQEKKEHPFEQMVVVFDLNGICSSHYSFKPFTNSFLTLLSIFQEHYPMLVKKIYLIRAPSMAYYVFKLLTPFLSERTKDLIEIPGDNWQEAVLNAVDAENWPNFLGGKLECPGESTKNLTAVRQGLGPVAESYYLAGRKDLFDGMQEATVYAGDKHLVEVEVEDVKSSIRWKYSTTGEDIGFAIYYDPSGNNVQELDGMQCVYPYLRLECSLVPVSGSVTCEKAGRYLVEFDNYYSWFSAKEIRYSVELVEP